MNIFSSIRAGVLSTILFAFVVVADDSELGLSIYRAGIGNDGDPINAILQGDVEVAGAQFACAGCHQRSGFGSSEGGLLVPPVTGDILFSVDESRRPELAEAVVRRPAYDDTALHRALTEGVDAAGRQMDAVMPRFVLSDSEFGALAGYLRNLSVKPAAGVDDDVIHLATIVDDSIEPAELDAMLAVMNQYITEKNSGTRNEVQRSENSPWFKDWHYSAFRTWQHHVWTLQGDPASWPAQLDAEYGKQPVFAVIGGASRRDWSPVHDFCASQELPCLLPNIINSPDDVGDFYSLYFSDGLKSEAKALAKWLPVKAAGATVVQLHTASSWGVVVAETLRARLPSEIELISIDADEPGAEEAVAQVLKDSSNIALVAWLPGGHDLWPTIKKSKNIERIIVSSTLIDDFSSTEIFGDHYSVFTAHQYHLGSATSKNRRLRAWAKTREIEIDHIRLQANSYYALTVSADALQHIRGHFSRELFLEKIEHMSRRILASSAYSKLSVAPGQRVMVKGLYILQVDSDGSLLRETADWIIP